MKYLLIIMLLFTNCTAWNAFSHPDKCGTFYQRQQFAQAEPCAEALRRFHLQHHVSPKLGNYMRVEHYRVTTKDYPPIMNAEEKKELAQLQHQDVDLCIEYSPSHPINPMPDEVGERRITAARILIPHVEVKTNENKARWCDK